MMINILHQYNEQDQNRKSGQKKVNVYIMIYRAYTVCKRVYSAYKKALGTRFSFHNILQNPYTPTVTN